jgi:threonine dehydratase
MGNFEMIKIRLLTSLGDKTFEIIKNHIDGFFDVSEEDIIFTMKLVWERMKILIEPSSAVPIAVALFSKEFKKLKNIENILIVISGGNVDFDQIKSKL